MKDPVEKVSVTLLKVFSIAFDFNLPFCQSSWVFMVLASSNASVLLCRKEAVHYIVRSESVTFFCLETKRDSLIKRYIL